MVNNLPFTKKHNFRPAEIQSISLDVTQKLKTVLRRAENILGKRENVVNQYFLLFPLFFQKVSLPEVC